MHLRPRRSVGVIPMPGGLWCTCRACSHWRMAAASWLCHHSACTFPRHAIAHMRPAGVLAAAKLRARECHASSQCMLRAELDLVMHCADAGASSGAITVSLQGTDAPDQPRTPPVNNCTIAGPGALCRNAPHAHTALSRSTADRALARCLHSCAALGEASRQDTCGQASCQACMAVLPLAS